MLNIRHERRKWDRIPLPVPLFVHGRDSDGQEFSDLTVARDIGGGGLLFASHRSLPRFTRLTIQVPSAPWLTKVRGTQDAQMLRGRIVRVVPTESLNFYALQFTHPLVMTRSKARGTRGLRSQSAGRVGARRAPPVDLLHSNQSRTRDRELRILHQGSGS
jgi:hypothetical protein